MGSTAQGGCTVGFLTGSLQTVWVPRGRHHVLPVLEGQQVPPMAINTIAFKQGVKPILHLARDQPQN